MLSRQHAELFHSWLQESLTSKTGWCQLSPVSYCLEQQKMRACVCKFRLSFRIPRNHQRRAAWLQALGYPSDYEPPRSSCICSLHFKEDDIDRTSLSVVRLRDDAVPTVAYQSQVRKPLVHYTHAHVPSMELTETMLYFQPKAPSQSSSASSYPTPASTSSACSASGSETVEAGQVVTKQQTRKISVHRIKAMHLITKLLVQQESLVLQDSVVILWL